MHHFIHAITVAALSTLHITNGFSHPVMVSEVPVTGRCQEPPLSPANAIIMPGKSLTMRGYVGCPAYVQVSYNQWLAQTCSVLLRPLGRMVVYSFYAPWTGGDTSCGLSAGAPYYEQLTFEATL